MTPRENMLRIINHEEAEWIPITVYADPFNHPSVDSLPDELAGLFKEKVSDFNSRWELSFALSDYLGIDEYMITSPRLFDLVPTGNVEEHHFQKGEEKVSTIKTSSGELRQIIRAGTVVKRYVAGPEDIPIFLEYIKSWKFKPNQVHLSKIEYIKNKIGENGMIWHYMEGTPLGMMYRLYSDITGLLYMTVDVPEVLRELFEIMEVKYQEAIEWLLSTVPEIDIIVGLDDTTTNIISPNMFETYNMDVINKRVDIAHKHSRYYLHHSCGLIKDLLPVYRKTKMDGVHAFNPPPVGNVTYDEGRKVLGENIAIYSNYENGLTEADLGIHKEIVKQRCEAARRARHVAFYTSSPDNLQGVDFIEAGLEVARKYQKY